MSAAPNDPPKDSPKERAGTLGSVRARDGDAHVTSGSARLVASVVLLVLSVPCLALGLPGIVLAIGMLVHTTLGRASARGPAMLLGVVAVSTWWPLAWCLVDARLDVLLASCATLAIAVLAAAFAPLVLAPLACVASTHTSDTSASDTSASDPSASDTSASDTSASDTSALAEWLARPASRHVTARVAVLLVALAALAPPIWLSPLPGYLLGASSLALGLAFGLPRALRAQRADVSSSSRHPRRAREGLALALAWTLAALSSLMVLQTPAPAAPGALGADTRAFDRARRAGPVLVSPHALGFVVSVADGGGVGLVRTPFGRPDRISIDVLEARSSERAIRVCAARGDASSCVVVDDDGVRLDDGPLDRARAAYGTSGLAMLATVASLLLALAIFGARRPRLVRTLAIASAATFVAFASMPWWP